MLIEFSVKNFRSILNEVLFSMVKGAGRELEDTHVLPAIPDAPVPLSPLLCSGVIYGPNAAGKTNLLLALAALQALILGSSRRAPDEPLPVTPCLCGEDSRTRPCAFEIHFIVNKVRYQYGISADQQFVHEEWLYAFPRGKAQKWFQRKARAGETVSFKFSSKLKGKKELWEQVTRPNASLLAMAAQLNSEQLAPVYNWFAEKLKIAIGMQGWNQSPLATLSLFEKKQQQKALQFMRAADFAISDLSLREMDVDCNVVTRDMPLPLRDMLIDQLAGAKSVEIRTRHKTRKGGRFELDLSEESDGTQKMFHYAGPWMDSLAKGNIMVIDELHDNLHPFLVRFLIQLFHNPELNRHGAQLIFTTHDTSLLTQKMFRRDQIWFCEQEEDQSTRLYPLSDFAVRKGMENIRLGYLSGRFGALPFLKAITEEFGQSHGE